MAILALKTAVLVPFVTITTTKKMMNPDEDYDDECDEEFDDDGYHLFEAWEERERDREDYADYDHYGSPYYDGT